MKLLEREEKEFVRIIIGVGTTKHSGIKAPTKTISVEGISVEEIADRILEIIQKEDPEFIKANNNAKPKHNTNRKKIRSKSV